MNLRSAIFAAGSAVFLLGLFLAHAPGTHGAEPRQAVPARGVCVGISTATLRTQDPVITRVYRVFADGTVETYDDGAPGAKWTQIGK
jgi:hypothetical protein